MAAGVAKFAYQADKLELWINGSNSPFRFNLELSTAHVEDLVIKARERI